MMNKKYFYFVFKNKDIDVNEIIKVNKMDYNDFVDPFYPNKNHSKIHGSEGLFANSLDEAMKLDLDFDRLMNDKISVDEF